jgi:hypothetical protein
MQKAQEASASRSFRYQDLSETEPHVAHPAMDENKKLKC